MTAADERKLTLLPEGTDSYLVKLDAAEVRTLRDCMQSTVEDGSKRERRYWIFDSGLGVKANSYTYHNDEMTNAYSICRRHLFMTMAIVLLVFMWNRSMKREPNEWR